MTFLLPALRLAGRLRLVRRRADIEALFLGEEAFVRRGIKSEIEKFRLYRKGLHELKVEASKALAENPWARETVREMVEDGMRAIKAHASGKGSTSAAHHGSNGEAAV